MTPDNAPPPYRLTAATSLDLRDAVALADQLLAEWLKEEGHDEPPPFEPERSPESERPPERLRLAERVLLDRDAGALGEAFPSGSYSRRRLRAPAPHGTLQLLLTVASAGDGQPVRVRVDADLLPTGRGVRPSGRGQVPELVRALLPLLDAVHGPTTLTLLPRVITVDGLDAVIDELCDPERRLPVVVASVPPGVRMEVWLAETVHPVMRQLPGLASLQVLSHAALPQFNLALEYHKVYGGAVRTYLPEVDPASRADALRHPVLPRHRIDEDVRRAAGLLAREPRRIAAGLPLPEVLAAVPALELPPEARVPLARRGPGGDGAEAGSGSTAQGLRRVGRELLVSGRRDLCPLSARPPVEAGPVQPGTVAPGTVQPGTVQRGTVQPGIVQSMTRQEGILGQAAAVESGVPSSFGELVGRFDEFPLLEFTGDEKETLALDGQSDGIGWARLTWDGLTALQEYAAAAVRGLAGGDFKQWCEDTPPGCHRFPPRKAVRGESHAVVSHAKWKRQRMLPVPACVEPSRRAFMGAHLRIGGGGTAPRVHYLDDCSGSGRIYVGYIGLHLTNTRTN